MNDRQSTSVVEVEGRGGWDYDISNLEWNKEYCIIITHTTSYVSTLTYIGHLRYFRLLIFGGLDVKNSLFNMLYLGFHNSKMVWLSSQKFIEFSLQPFAYYWPPHAKFALGFEEIWTAHKKPFNFWSFKQLVFETLGARSFVRAFALFWKSLIRFFWNFIWNSKCIFIIFNILTKKLAFFGPKW